jgi:hypothetical protein
VGRGSIRWRGEDPSGGCEENPQRPPPTAFVGGARGPSDGGTRGPSDGGAGNPSGGGLGILWAVAQESFGRRRVGPWATALWIPWPAAWCTPWPAARRCGVSPADDAEEWGIGFSACAREWGKWLVPFFSHREEIIWATSHCIGPCSLRHV